jgi:hypothetical protein
MRSILLAAALVLPTLAAAQTPRDLARLTWPLGAPALSGQPHAPTAGAASAADLARLAGISAARAGEFSTPATETAGAATAGSLANLMGGPAWFRSTPAAAWAQTAGTLPR